MLRRLLLGAIVAALLVGALMMSLMWFGVYALVGLATLIFLLGFGGVLIRQKAEERGELKARRNLSSARSFARRKQAKLDGETVREDREA